MPEAELALQVAEPRRLVISEMVLENFKSYAGVQRVGPFHKVKGGQQAVPVWAGLQADLSQAEHMSSHTCNPCRASPLWWDPTAVASPTS